jgi:hypothetical protein
VSLPDHPIAGPYRQWLGTMGHKVEAGPERVRHHVPRPHTNKMITRPDQIHRSSQWKKHERVRRARSTMFIASVATVSSAACRTQ